MPQSLASSSRRLVVLALLGPLAAACAVEAPPDEAPWTASQHALTLQVPAQYPTIQAAVDAAAPGDTVSVAPGAYYQSVTMKSGVRLVASGSGQTLIGGQIRLGSATACTVSGFLIGRQQAVGLTSNVGVTGAPGGNTISGNTIQGFDVGVLLAGPGDAVVSGNIITNAATTGVRLSSVGDVRVLNNAIRFNKHVGVEVRGASAARVFHNTFVANGFGGQLTTGGAAFYADRAGNARVQNNVITGNNGGMNVADGPNPDHHHNLVWGNTADYAGAATVGAGDVAADPRFTDAGNKDFRLLTGSPAIDGGVDVGVTTDFHGDPRPAGGAPDLGAFEHAVPAAAGELVITEVMANPLDEGRGEYVELFNPTPAPIDAAGLSLDDGDASDALVAWAGGTTVVPAGGYAVVLDPDYPLGSGGPYTIPAAAVLLTVGNSTLGSGLAVNDPVTLYRGFNAVSTFAYPFDPGNGVAAERLAVDAPDARSNWTSAPCGGSPGGPNCAAAGTVGPPPGAPTLTITEVMANPSVQASGEFVELYNFGTAPVELAGLVVSDGDSSDVLVAVAGKASLLAPGAYGVVIDPDGVAGLAGAPYFLGGVATVVTVPPAAIGNGLAQDDPVVLLASDGQTVLSSYSHGLPVASGASVERKGPLAADTGDAWLKSPCPAGHSAGLPNCAATAGGPTTPALPVLVINEIMANPLDEDTGEYVELYNAGTTAADAAGLYLSDGDAVDALGAFAAGGATLIPPGGYAVILDPEYAGEYVIPAAAIRLAPDDTSVGNGLATNDPITLLASDQTTVIATFSFPTNPGNGVSIERVGAAGDVASNWVASPCAGGASPGARNCAAGPPLDLTPVLVISEVMANPLDEGTGEFVELANIGAGPVDVADYVLSDGDASDTLRGYGGGGTVIPAGGWAVVLDSDYVSGTYAIPGGAVLLTTGDKTLGSGLATDDPITLLAADGVTVLSTWLHPFNPGNGVSAERVELTAPDGVGAFVAASCASGSSPGGPNCAAGEPTPSGVTVVDVNSASSAQLQEVTGIGPATATKIIDYRAASGAYDALEQLMALTTVTPAQVADWSVAEAGEAPFVLGVTGGKTVKVYPDVASLKDQLPLPDSAAAAAWVGALVRVERATMLDDDSASGAAFTFGDWGYEGSYEPEGDEQLQVVLGAAPGAGSYARAHTDLVNAMADWETADGDPYLVPAFYRWGTPAAGGYLAYAHVYALQGVLEVSGGDWRLRVRARADAGVDRVVLIERWLPAADWQELDIIWAYGYRPVVVVAAGGFLTGLPYRLALAHPARTWWFETQGVALPMPQCTSYWECEADDGSWDAFNTVLDQWHGVAAAPGSVQAVLAGIPGNAGQLASVTGARVAWRSGGLLEVCDAGTTHCLRVYTAAALPATLGQGDTVAVTGTVTWYAAGDYWELLVGAGGSVQLLTDL